MDYDTTKQLEFVVNDLARRMARLYNRVFEQTGVSQLQAAVLAFLHYEGLKTQTELANRMEKSPAAMGALLDRMEAAGLIERLSSKRDRRVNFLKLTKNAAPIVAQIHELSSQIGPSIRVETTKKERRDVIAVLNKIKKNIEREEQRLVDGVDE